MRIIAISLCLLCIARTSYAQSDGLKAAKVTVTKLKTALKEADANFQKQNLKVNDYRSKRDLLDAYLAPADLTNEISINKNLPQVANYKAKTAALKQLQEQNVVEKLFKEWSIDGKSVMNTYRYGQGKNADGKYVEATGGQGKRNFARDMLYGLLPHMEKGLQEAGAIRNRLNDQLMAAQAVLYDAAGDDAASEKLAKMINESDMKLADYKQKRSGGASSDQLKEEISKLDRQQKTEDPSITAKMQAALDEMKALSQKFADAKSPEARESIARERGRAAAQFYWLSSQARELGFDPLALREYDKKRLILVDQLREAEERETAQKQAADAARRRELEARLPDVKKALSALKILGPLPNTFDVDEYATNWVDYMTGVVIDAVTPPGIGGGTALTVGQIVAAWANLRKTELIPSNSNGYQRMLGLANGKPNKLEEWLVRKEIAGSYEEATRIRREMEELTDFKSPFE